MKVQIHSTLFSYSALKNTIMYSVISSRMSTSLLVSIYEKSLVYTKTIIYLKF